jgi:uncharacterized protein (TIGR02646 family)
MHWVDRGPEPQRLRMIRNRYTPRWIGFYRNNSNPKPSDSAWRGFHKELGAAFYGICGYCEEVCRGEVDHFKPKSKFPESVYQWSNWIFACHDCNRCKAEKWASVGYVNPCAPGKRYAPETYFDFDLITGEIIPILGLGSRQRRKALRMISDLGLNNYHHLKRRAHQLRTVSLIVDSLDYVLPQREAKLRRFLRSLCSRDEESSTLTRRYLSTKGMSIR